MPRIESNKPRLNFAISPFCHVQTSNVFGRYHKLAQPSSLLALTETLARPDDYQTYNLRNMACTDGSGHAMTCNESGLSGKIRWSKIMCICEYVAINIHALYNFQS